MIKTIYHRKQNTFISRDKMRKIYALNKLCKGY